MIPVRSRRGSERWKMSEHCWLSTSMLIHLRLPSCETRRKASTASCMASVFKQVTMSLSLIRNTRTTYTVGCLSGRKV